MIPFICNIQNKQIPKNKLWLPRTGERRAEEVIANGYRVFFLEEDVLKLDSGNDCRTLKTTLITHFKGVNVMACELYLNKAVSKKL